MGSQETALRLHEFRKEEACPIIPPYGSLPSGDLTPDLFFVALGAKPWRVCQGMAAANCDEMLSAASVAVDPEGCERIVRGAISFATNETKTTAYIDDGLLSEIAHGTESPQPVIGEVGSPLDLPLVFASASLRGVGFVPLNLDNTGRIKFAGFADDPVNETMVRAGFECVTRSALGGCQLLFSRDRKASLADHVRYLRGIVDQGSLGDHCGRKWSDCAPSQRCTGPPGRPTPCSTVKTHVSAPRSKRWQLLAPRAVESPRSRKGSLPTSRSGMMIFLAIS